MKPLVFNAIVFELTARCNAQCKMCYQAAGPKGSSYIGDSALTLDDVVRVLDQARALPGLPDRVHFGGGEGFLDADMIIGAIAHASIMGFGAITAVSNCFWGSTPERAQTMAERLANAGLHQMEISWDVWHAPYVSAQRVANAVRALYAAGIQTNLRLLTTRSVRAHEAYDMLGQDIIEALDEVCVGNVLPTGKAAEEFAHADLYPGPELSRGCPTNLNLTINPAGRVAPCCSGADQTEALTFGDIRTQSLEDIVQSMQRSALLSTLVHEGAEPFLNLLREHGFDLAENEAFLGACHACWAVFSNPEQAKLIKQIYDVVEPDRIEALAQEYFNAEHV